MDRQDSATLKALYRQAESLMEGAQKVAEDLEGEIDKKQHKLLVDYVVGLEGVWANLRSICKELKVKGVT